MGEGILLMWWCVCAFLPLPYPKNELLLVALTN